MTQLVARALPFVTYRHDRPPTALIPDRLPRPLFIRSVAIGSIMGSATSALQILQSKIGDMRTDYDEASIRTTNAANGSAPSVPTSDQAHDLSEGSTVVLPVDHQMAPELRPEVSSTLSEKEKEGSNRAMHASGSESGGGGWTAKASGLWSWIPGMGGKSDS